MNFNCLFYVCEFTQMRIKVNRDQFRKFHPQFSWDLVIFKKKKKFSRV